MDRIDPKKVLGNLFSILEGYPPKIFRIIVYTDQIFVYVISTFNGKYQVRRISPEDDEDDMGEISNVKDFLKI